MAAKEQTGAPPPFFQLFSYPQHIHLSLSRLFSACVFRSGAHAGITTGGSFAGYIHLCVSVDEAATFVKQTEFTLWIVKQVAVNTVTLLEPNPYAFFLPGDNVTVRIDAASIYATVNATFGVAAYDGCGDPSSFQGGRAYPFVDRYELVVVLLGSGGRGMATSFVWESGFFVHWCLCLDWPVFTLLVLFLPFHRCWLHLLLSFPPPSHPFCSRSHLLTH